MTRHSLSLLAGTLLFCGAAAGAPSPAVPLRAGRMPGHVDAVRGDPLVSRTSLAAFDVHVGDGIFRLRIRGYDRCAASVTVEVRLDELWQLIRSMVRAS